MVRCGAFLYVCRMFPGLSPTCLFPGWGRSRVKLTPSFVWNVKGCGCDVAAAQNNEAFDYNPEYAKLYQEDNNEQSNPDTSDEQLLPANESPGDFSD